jgi:hypothetical protein
MSMPVREQFNNSTYYKQPLPAAIATSRLWQLVYGEFRAPMYMAVLRDRLERFAKAEYDHTEALVIIRLLSVWSCISDNRRTEWPVVRQMIRVFVDRLLSTTDGIAAIEPWTVVTPAWVDDDSQWSAVVIEPYHALQR